MNWTQSEKHQHSLYIPMKIFCTYFKMHGTATRQADIHRYAHTDIHTENIEPLTGGQYCSKSNS